MGAKEFFDFGLRLYQSLPPFRDPAVIVGTTLRVFDNHSVGISKSIERFLIQTASGKLSSIEVAEDVRDQLDDAITAGGHISPRTARSIRRQSVEQASSILRSHFESFEISPNSKEEQKHAVTFGQDVYRNSLMTPLEDFALHHKGWNFSNISTVIEVRESIESIASDLKRTVRRLVTGSRGEWSQEWTSAEPVLGALTNRTTLSKSHATSIFDASVGLSRATV